MTKLTDLEPVFVAWDGNPHHGGWVELPTMQGADGVEFYCPKGGDRACRILCWNKSVPLSIDPTPGRWNMAGTSLEDLTLSSSVDVSGGPCGCGWHGFIQNGEVA